MRRRHTEQNEDIAIFERELASLSKTITDFTKAESKIATQAAKISDLTDVMQLQRKKLRSQRTELKELSKLKGEVGRLQDAVEEEQKRRIEAERKLKEYFDAQKKIAAQFG
jgi:chromosome segregation ATPase